jgi:protein SCO1/2
MKRFDCQNKTNNPDAQGQCEMRHFRNYGHYSFPILSVTVFLIIGFIGQSAFAQAIQQNPPELKGVGVEEHLGGYIPLTLDLTNDLNQPVKLGDYFHKNRPVILILAYYDCPMLCTLVMNGVADAVKKLSLVPGKDYDILTVSINPLETAQLAAAKKKTYVNYIGKSEFTDGWTFFVAAQPQIDSLTKAVGFQYYYDKIQKQYAHPAVIYILSPQGEITRYFYGLEFNEKDLRFALLEAAQGKIGNTVDKFILYCYHYDPQAKGYVLFAAKLMRLGGIATVVLIALFLGVFWRKELNRRKKGFV